MSATPTVGDLDGDGAPEVIAPGADGTLRVFDVQNGSLVWSFAGIEPANASAVIGDLHPSPGLEVAAIVPTGSVTVFPAAGPPAIDTFDTGGVIGEGNLALAHVGGEPAIVVPVDDGIQLLGFDTDTLVRRWTSPAAGCGNNSTASACIPVVADIDLDGVAEVVAGTTVYDGDDGSIETEGTTPPDGWTAIGQFDLDDEAEIVVVHDGQVYALNHDMTPIWGPIEVDGIGGPPTIADLDGDDQPEVALATSSGPLAIDTDGTVIWRALADGVLPSFDTASPAYQAIRDATRPIVVEGAAMGALLTWADLSERSVDVYQPATNDDGIAMGFNEMLRLADPAALRTGVVLGVPVSESRRAAAAALADAATGAQGDGFALPERVAEYVAYDLADPRLEPIGSVATNLDTLAALEASIATTIGRLDAATAAGDAPWAARQLRALLALLDAHEQAALAFQSATAAHAPEYVGDDNIFTIRLVYNNLDTLVDGSDVSINSAARIWNTGITPDEQDVARDVFRATIPYRGLPLGLGPDGWAALARDLAPATGTLTDALQTWADGELTPLLAELDALVGSAAPAVTITATGVVEAGGDVSLSIDGASATAVRWDLDGDGVADDGAGTTTTYTVPGGAVPGSLLVVTAEVDTADGTALALAPLTVEAGGNTRPTVIGTDTGKVLAEPGDVVSFTGSVSDPDGDDTTVEWLVDGVVVQEGGTTFDLELPTDRSGTSAVELAGVDAGGSRTHVGWAVHSVPRGDATNPTSLTPTDEDNDTFFAAPGPDCDDSSNLVSPALGEVLGNGLDDDCDPTTPDSRDWTGNTSSAFPALFNGFEGDRFTFQVSGWSHPDRYSGDPFTLTVEWPDGTTDSQTVSVSSLATRVADTTFRITKQFDRPISFGSWRYCVVDDTAGETVGCTNYSGSISVIEDVPLSNAADLRTWEEDKSIELNPTLCVGGGCVPGEWAPLDPDGRHVVSGGNPSTYNVIYDPLPLAADGYGRATFEVATLQANVGVDDDFIGFVLGYQAGEIGGLVPDSDFVAFQWRGGTQRSFQTLVACNDAFFDPREVPENSAIGRWRGQVLNIEGELNDTLRVPYDDTDDDSADGGIAQDPRCNDDDGVELLSDLDVPDGVNVNRFDDDAWWTRSTLSYRDNRFGNLRLDPYVLTVDYRPDRLVLTDEDGVVWADLVPSDPNDPFPPGSIGLFYNSQGGVRAAATAPEPRFSFVEGVASAIEVPAAEGGADEIIATVDWGDGTSRTRGVVAGDPERGFGWRSVSASHAYRQPGQYIGEVCIRTDRFDHSCSTFIADVGPTVPSSVAAIDVEGDGSSEIVVSDGGSLRILDGATGVQEVACEHGRPRLTGWTRGGRRRR